MLSRAETHYKEAIKLKPGSTRSRFNLAVLYIAEGRLEPARSELEEVLELNPGHRRARKFLDYVKKEQSPHAPRTLAVDVRLTCNRNRN